MKKFGNYPIYINHPGRLDEVRQRQRQEFAEQHDQHMVDWLAHTGRRLYEITEDRNPGPAARAYEQDVFDQLTRILTTTMGKMLLGSLNRDLKYWILPLDLIDRKWCDCGAYTFPGAPKEGGGVRIYYNPTDFGTGARRWIGPDDVLFHELVHAYRYGRVGFDMMSRAKAMTGYDDSEEFLALQLQNIYLADRGATAYYTTYTPLRAGSSDKAYEFFENNAEPVMALRYFIENEPLATAVSHWKSPANSFNPWRDQQALEQTYIRNAGVDLKRLPSF